MWLDSCRQLVVVRNCKLELHHRRKEVRFRSDCHKKNEVWMASSYLIQEGFLGRDQNEWVIYPPPDSTWWGLWPSFTITFNRCHNSIAPKRAGRFRSASNPPWNSLSALAIFTLPIAKNNLSRLTRQSRSPFIWERALPSPEQISYPLLTHSRPIRLPKSCHRYVRCVNFPLIRENR